VPRQCGWGVSAIRFSPSTHTKHTAPFFCFLFTTLKRQKKKDHIFCPLTRQNTNKQTTPRLGSPFSFLSSKPLRSFFVPRKPTKSFGQLFFFPFLFSKTLSKGRRASFFAFSWLLFFVCSLAQSLPSSLGSTLSQLTKVFRIQQNHRHYQTFPHFPSCNPFSCFRVMHFCFVFALFFALFLLSLLFLSLLVFCCDLSFGSKTRETFFKDRYNSSSHFRPNEGKERFTISR